MNTCGMTLDELFQYTDNDLTKRWAETTTLTPEQAIEKAEQAIDGIKDAEQEYAGLKVQFEQTYEQKELIVSALDRLRRAAFAAEYYRNQEDFDDSYDRYEEGSVTVTEYQALYCPDLEVTAMFTLIEEGELVEVWATNYTNYFSNKTTFWRVF